MLKRNLNHVRRTLVAGGEVTPPETESEGSRSDAEAEDLEAEFEGVKKQDEVLQEKKESVLPHVLEQGDSLSQALGGVELD
jgi:type III polyketide synthase